MDSEGIVARKKLPVSAFTFAMAVVLVAAFVILATQASALWSARSQPAASTDAGAGSFGSPYARVGGHWLESGANRHYHWDKIGQHSYAYIKKFPSRHAYIRYMERSRPLRQLEAKKGGPRP